MSFSPSPAARATPTKMPSFWQKVDALFDAAASVAHASPAKSYARSVRASLRMLREDMGVRLATPQALGGRHVDLLVNHWKQEGVGATTLSNRLYALRWFGELIGKPGMVRKNAHYGVENTGNAQPREPELMFDQAVFTRVHAEDPTAAYVLWLQMSTGCTREEALRARGTDLKAFAWTRASSPGSQASTLRIAAEHVDMVPAVVKHILEQHGSIRASLGWSAPYARSECPRLGADLRRCKYLAKKLALARLDRSAEQIEPLHKPSKAPE